MPRLPQDHKLPSANRRGFDAQGRAPGERLSEYFDFERWPEKKTKAVTRLELLAILTREYKVKQASTWPRRVWAYLTRPFGSAPATLATTKGEAERGEVNS